MNVSRETNDRLRAFTQDVLKWNKRINLISKSDSELIYSRHVENSLELATLQAQARKWCDLGSGGGFPGMVVAIATGIPTTLIESDLRKAAFLRSAARNLDLPVDVIAQRIEIADPQEADVVSARALAPLVKLLDYGQRHVAERGEMLLQKGGNHIAEIDEARRVWAFECDIVSSKTDLSGVILRIRNVERA